jgi:hypothetical protein
MNGKRAKAIRRAALSLCDESITRMRLRAYKKAEVLLKDDAGKLVIDVGTGKPIVVTPEHHVYTAFWPMDAYRRVVKHIKRGGRSTGVTYDVSVPGPAHG